MLSPKGDVSTVVPPLGSGITKGEGKEAWKRQVATKLHLLDTSGQLH